MKQWVVLLVALAAVGMWNVIEGNERASEVAAFNVCVDHRRDAFNGAFKPWYQGLSKWEKAFRHDLPHITTVGELTARLAERSRGYAKSDPNFDEFFATRCVLGQGASPTPLLSKR